MRNVRSRLRALLATAAATTAAATLLVSAAAADPGGQSGTAKSGTKPTVALVHGGFADASNWNAVITELQKDGWGLVATTTRPFHPPSNASSTGAPTPGTSRCPVPRTRC
ncbi:hypothetical protein AB0D78_22070 [Streptomyces avermitilis]|uniref:hypothetical protein n=1 Tax=Streptomyces avermitilis TaxID=33903 RepID=UPI0033E26312